MLLTFLRFPYSTLARTVKSDESSATGAAYETLQLQLEKTRKKTRNRQPAPLGNRIEIARLAGRQTHEHRVCGHRRTGTFFGGDNPGRANRRSRSKPQLF